MKTTLIFCVYILALTSSELLTCDVVKATYQGAMCCGALGTRPVDATCAAIDALDNVARFDNGWQDIYVNGVAHQKAFRNLALSSAAYTKNGASAFSFLRALGTTSRRVRATEFNFGWWEVKIVAPLTGEYYDILMSTKYTSFDMELMNYGVPVGVGIINQTRGFGSATPGSATFAHDAGTANPPTDDFTAHSSRIDGRWPDIHAKPNLRLTPRSANPGMNWTTPSVSLLSGNINSLSAHFPGHGVQCISASKSAESVAAALDHFNNLHWVTGSIGNPPAIAHFFNVMNDGSRSIKNIHGQYYHPPITAANWYMPTKLYMTVDPTEPYKMHVKRTAQFEYEMVVESMVVELGTF